MTPQNKPILGAVLAAALLLAGCADLRPLVPEPLVKPRVNTETGQLLSVGGNPVAEPVGTTSVQVTPKPPPPANLSTIKPATPPPLTGGSTDEPSITVAFDQMPLPNFIQAIYGLVLKKTYSLDPQVAQRKDLVTLRAATLQTPTQIERAARQLLKTYGVAVSDLGAGNYRITPDNSQAGYSPQILRGRAMPDVPLPLRPVYQLVELRAVRSTELVSWLTKIFAGKVTLQDDSPNNTLIISGQSDDVTAVLAAIQVLDQPTMKGRNSQRINPVFWSADELAKKLADVLTAEGYRVTRDGAGQYPINLIPIAGVNALIVFTSDPAVMDHVVAWAKDFDKPNPALNASGSYFTYRVRNTNAEGLAKTMQALLNEGPAAPAQPIPVGAVVVGPAIARAAPRPSRVIVNAATNTLIFQGDNGNQSQLLNLLLELDKPAKAALIEVTVAEVTLDDSTQLGVEWALAQSALPWQGGTLAGQVLGDSVTTAGLKLGTSGLTMARLTGAGQLRALLNALATSSKANVLSSPRVLARSGETASIVVGSEIPTISQQQTNAATGGTGVLQTVEYRKTGVILNVKPIIYSGDRIDLDVTQEVSDSTKLGAAGSPVIDTRKVDTHLSLRDGTPVLLGGLISQTTSRSERGVPLFKDIPLAGQLFRTNTDETRKTELLVLITPYIVADDHDATEITEAFRKQLGDWAKPLPVVPRQQQ